MRYIKCKLSDGTKVKFKIKLDNVFEIHYNLTLSWKYVGKFNFSKDVELHTYGIQKLQQMTDEELVNICIPKIEKEHKIIKNTKRIIC